MLTEVSLYLERSLGSIQPVGQLTQDGTPVASKGAAVHACQRLRFEGRAVRAGGYSAVTVGSQAPTTVRRDGFFTAYLPPAW